VPDLYGWIVEQIKATERAIRDRESVFWGVGLGAESVARFVFRQCAADRKLLTLHKPRGVDWDAEARDWAGNPNVCEGCGQEGICQDWVTEHANDCPVLLAVAEGYGLTETERAVLDRPQWKPGGTSGPSVLGEAVARAWETAVRASLEASGVCREAFVLSDSVEPSPKEKALSILKPELRTIPLYRPSEGEQGESR
jgi:hypothetical protein